MEEEMRIIPLFALAVLSITLAPTVHASDVSDTTIDGVVSDTMCGRTHMLLGKTDAQCVQECTKGNASYSLVTSAKVFMLEGKPLSVAPFAGKRVHIVGNLKGNLIIVTSIREATHDAKM